MYLIRAEERYGNGDHIYTVEEQTNAINALYDAGRGEQEQYGAPAPRPAGLRDQLLTVNTSEPCCGPAASGRRAAREGAVFLSKEDGMRFSRCQRVVWCGQSSRRPGAGRHRIDGGRQAEAREARRVPALLQRPARSSRPNRVQCRVFSTGQICATGSSTVGGGIWPRGTADQYIFGSGINIAGIIDAGRQVGERVRG